MKITNLERGTLSVRCSYENRENAQGAWIEMPLLYFPGYRGEDGNGNPLPVHFSGPSGEIHVFFRERRLWRAAELVSLLTAAWFIWEICRHRSELSEER